MAIVHTKSQPEKVEEGKRHYCLFFPGQRAASRRKRKVLFIFIDLAPAIKADVSCLESSCCPGEHLFAHLFSKELSQYVHIKIPGLEVAHLCGK